MIKKKKTKPDAAMLLAIKHAKFPDGRIVYGPAWCEKLAQAVRRLNARAVKKERAMCVGLVVKECDRSPYAGFTMQTINRLLCDMEEFEQ